MAICVSTPKHLKIVCVELSLTTLISYLRSGEGFNTNRGKKKMLDISSKDMTRVCKVLVSCDNGIKWLNFNMLETDMM